MSATQLTGTKNQNIFHIGEHNKLTSEKVQIFLANDKFIAPRFRFLYEAARFGSRFVLGLRSRYLFKHRVARHERGLFLVSSNVQLQELETALGPIQGWLDPHIFSGVRQTLLPKARLLALIPEAVALLWRARKLTHLFHFLYHVYSYEVVKAYLDKMNRAYVPGAFGCFELLYLGAAISDYCGENNLKSIFVQHGLFDQACLPYHFDESYLWHVWDKELFETVRPIGVINLKYPNYSPPTQRFTSRSKVIFFALEYPSTNLRPRFIADQVGQLVDAAKRLGWTLVLRPHPRDNSNLIEYLALRYPQGFKVDPYSELPVLESFRRNSAAIFVTFNSASIIEASAQGIFCLSINNPLQSHILVPFSSLSLQLETAQDIEPILMANPSLA